MRRKDYKENLLKQLEDPNFRREWEMLDPEIQIVCTMLENRKKKGITQVQLADSSGVTQADISRIEKGTANPSLRTLKRLAEGMGMRLKLEFVDMQ